MTITVDWKTYIGGFDNYSAIREGRDIPVNSTEFTSRVRGFQVEHRIDLGFSGRSTATVTLDNHDGALTPGAGGALDLDWFAEPLFINGGTSVSYFIGPIVDFEFTDDGFDSTVTLTALDWGTFAGRFTFKTGWTETQTVDTIVDLKVLDPPTFINFMPVYGGNEKTKNVYSPGTWETVTATASAGDYAGDLIGTLLSSDGGFSYPPRMLFWEQDIGGGGTPNAVLSYNWYGMPRRHLAASAYESTTFTSTGSLGSTGLPFRKLKLGFNIDELVTQAEATRSGGTPQNAYSDTATGTYGPRSVSYGELLVETDTDALDLATWYVARFSTVDFGPSQLEITGAMIQQHAADTASAVVDQLVSPNSETEGVLFKPITVAWTGAGSTSNTTTVAAFRSVLKATPSDWSMRLWTRDATQVFGFTLDDSELGVLDQNRLG